MIILVTNLVSTSVIEKYTTQQESDYIIQHSDVLFHRLNKLLAIRVMMIVQSCLFYRGNQRCTILLYYRLGLAEAQYYYDYILYCFFSCHSIIIM